MPREGTGQAAAPGEESLESLLAQMEKKFQFWEVFGGWEEVDLDELWSCGKGSEMLMMVHV